MDAVDIWWIALDRPPATVAACHAMLDPEERGRAAGYGQPVLRRRFIVAHAAMRTIIGGYVARAPSRLRWRYGRWGKPALARPAGAVRFNLAHTEDIGLLAVSRRRAVGVDVEHRRAGFPAAAFVERFFPAAEREPDDFVRLWTRKEACVKAAGTRVAPGLAVPVSGAVVRGASGTWTLEDLEAPPGYAACVAVVGAEPFTVTIRAGLCSARPRLPRGAVRRDIGGHGR